MGLFGKSKSDNGDKNKLHLKAEFNQPVQDIFKLVLSVEDYPSFIDEVEKVSSNLTGPNKMETEVFLKDEVVEQAAAKLTEACEQYKIPVPKKILSSIVPKSQKVEITWNEFDKISVRNMGGLGDNIVSTWHFTPAANGSGTNIDYETDYSGAGFMVRQALNMGVVQTFFKERSAETVEAVKQEAEKIFARRNGGGPSGPPSA